MQIDANRGKSTQIKIKSAVEVARWDESKRWQSKLENLKSKLSDADFEVSKLSKTNNSLRDMVSRLEREKLTLESRLKHKSSSSVKSNISEIKMKGLQVENSKLREELEATRHDFMMQGTQGIETLKLRNKFLQDRIEAQERKIAALELAKKVGGESSKVIKKLEEIQDKEKECQKHKLRLEEENMELKYKLEHFSHPQIQKVVRSLEVYVNNLRESHQEVLALELKSLIDELNTNEDQPKLLSPKKKTKELVDEVSKLKAMNEELISKLEDKSKELEDLKALKNQHPRVTALTTSSQAVPNMSSPYAVPNMEEVRKMEADLKRKSDLLSEVKVLLKQAADRERSILAAKDEMSHKLKLILEVDPKSPSEALAKELRQARLTIDRLQNEQKELEHRIELMEKEQED